MKKLGLVLTAIAAMSFGSLTASAGEPPVPYPPPTTVTLTLTPSTVSPGATFTATFRGCSLGEAVNFTFNGATVSASSVASAAETFRRAPTGPSATVTLTAPTVVGVYPVVATCVTSGSTATASLTVVAAAPGGGPLPATGSDSSSTVQVAGGLVAMGAGLAFVGGLRYRRKHALAL